jgi:hypothetical protein
LRESTKTGRSPANNNASRAKEKNQGITPKQPRKNRSKHSLNQENRESTSKFHPMRKGKEKNKQRPQGNHMLLGEFERKKRKEAKTLPEFDPKNQGPIQALQVKKLRGKDLAIC